MHIIALMTNGTNIVPAGILFRNAQIPTLNGFFSFVILSFLSNNTYIIEKVLLNIMFHKCKIIYVNCVISTMEKNMNLEILKQEDNAYSLKELLNVYSKYIKNPMVL